MLKHQTKKQAILNVLEFYEKKEPLKGWESDFLTVTEIHECREQVIKARIKKEKSKMS